MWIQTYNYNRKNAIRTVVYKTILKIQTNYQESVDCKLSGLILFEFLE